MTTATLGWFITGICVEFHPAGWQLYHDVSYTGQLGQIKHIFNGEERI